MLSVYCKFESIGQFLKRIPHVFFFLEISSNLFNHSRDILTDCGQSFPHPAILSTRKPHLPKNNVIWIIIKNTTKTLISKRYVDII